MQNQRDVKQKQKTKLIRFIKISIIKSKGGKMKKKKELKKADVLSEDKVKEYVIKWLSRNDYGDFTYGDKKDRGPDIKAKKNGYGVYYIIEAKKEGATAPLNDNYFLNSLGQIITRMNVGKRTKYSYGLALPEKSAKIALRRIPWQVCEKLNLRVLMVSKDGTVKEYKPKDIKKEQEKK